MRRAIHEALHHLATQLGETESGDCSYCNGIIFRQNLTTKLIMSAVLALRNLLRDPHSVTLNCFIPKQEMSRNETQDTISLLIRHAN
jgi:hypothetical protein